MSFRHTALAHLSALNERLVRPLRVSPRSYTVPTPEVEAPSTKLHVFQCLVSLSM
ncbi:hypothetical protein PC116_g11959 [Phytophthora cactorum]|nr:hypothetical protein PC123_g5491 [Phytophthora cactorum]KAG4240051.1 hypothetical protein PC116_g11959 [Phytophthora cactorum]